MLFRENTQEELKSMNVVAGEQYKIRYKNKDYYNGDETIEEGLATAVVSDGKIFFNVVDPYGMDKLVMQVKVLQD